MLLVTAWVAGCGGDDPLPPAAEPDRASAAIRIVSLSPAISRTLLDLDLAGAVVGRSGYCRSLDPVIPAVGDQLTIDYERLVRLDPTHVLVQPPATGIDAELVRLAGAHGWTIGRWRLDTVADIRVLVDELPALLGDAAVRPRADALLRRLDAAVAPAGAARWTGSTLLLCQVEPVLVFGRETYLDELLTAQGGRNATSATGWATLSLEDVTRLDPEAIVVVRGAVEGAEPSAVIRPLSALPIRAVRNGRVAVLADPDAMLPSSAVVAVGEKLREILDAFSEPAP
jgi:ABC-type Fe3+-hydroxamate transport system substrate-binding protein